MNTITKRIFNLFLAIFIMVNLLPQNVLIANAATNAMVYEDSPMLEDGGNIYYIQTVQGDKNSYNNIYRLEVATGNKTRLLSSKYRILGMMLHKDTLYYTSYDGEKDHTYSVSIDAKNKKTICNGHLLCLDDSSIYYTVNKGEEGKLYKREYGSKKATLLYTGNFTLSFVKNLDNTLYFTQFNEASSKLTLYTLAPKQTKLTVLTTDKITFERTYPTVSDIVKINGDIYYQYGSYEGTGDYWYGKLIKLDSGTNTKSVIAKLLYEEQIYHNDNIIFYNGNVYKDNEEVRYQYNTKTSKTSTYRYKTTASESFNILGDYTYCAKADGKKLITVSRFTSGTDQNNLVKSFIKLTYKQEKEYDYSARVKRYGDYLLIPVTCMDYNANNGWRGRYVSITWYVADLDGKILAQLQ